MRHTLHDTLQAAIATGLLPKDTPLPAHDDPRPWPVVLLTALGAWLAALPLLGVVHLLLGDWLRHGVGPYFIGALVLAGAAVVLRSRGLPLFAEQLAVPALLVGGATLGYGLFRDLANPAAAAVLAGVATALALALPRPWLRVLLGASAAWFACLAVQPGRWFDHGPASVWRLWLAWHSVLALWGLGLTLQRRSVGLAVAIESFASGWLLAVLAGLAVWSGMSFLVGASLGGGFVGDVARELGTRPNAAWGSLLMPATSVVLAAIAAFLSARGWPALRRPLFIGAAAVLVALAWWMPALGAVVLALSVCALSQRWHLAAAAAFAAAWIVGSFYYQLQWPLATKATVLVLAGAALGALAWLARERTVATREAVAVPRGRAWLLAIGGAAALAVANLGIWQKEDLIAHGQAVFVELAPVDPRSLMQGDFMRLNFAVPGDVQTRLDSLVTLDRPRVVALRDARGIAQLKRLDDGAPLAAGEIAIELTLKNGRWVFVTDAWFFSEGDAVRWAAAKYGEFRVGADGRALLVGLRGAELRAL
jgi:uncharacterized membrane-anchored protein